MKRWTKLLALVTVLVMLLGLAPAAALAEGGHTHNWKERSRTEPTCTQPGSVTYVCSCGEKKVEPIPALGHAWNEGEIVADELTPGGKLLRRQCWRCGEIWDEPLPADTPDDYGWEPPEEPGETDDPGGEVSPVSEEPAENALVLSGKFILSDTATSSSPGKYHSEGGKIVYRLYLNNDTKSKIIDLELHTVWPTGESTEAITQETWKIKMEDGFAYLAPGADARTDNCKHFAHKANTLDGVQYWQEFYVTGVLEDSGEPICSNTWRFEYEILHVDDEAGLQLNGNLNGVWDDSKGAYVEKEIYDETDQVRYYFSLQNLYSVCIDDLEMHYLTPLGSGTTDKAWFHLEEAVENWGDYSESVMKTVPCKFIAPLASFEFFDAKYMPACASEDGICYWIECYVTGVREDNGEPVTSNTVRLTYYTAEVEPEPEPPASPWPEEPDCCVVTLRDRVGGTSEWTLERCPDHAAVAAEAEGKTPEEALALWTAALDAAYDEWLAEADEAQRPLIEAERAAFQEQLLAYGAAWELRGGKEYAAKKMTELVMHKVSLICFAREASGEDWTAALAGEAVALPYELEPERCQQYSQDKGLQLQAWDALCPDHRQIAPAAEGEEGWRELKAVWLAALNTETDALWLAADAEGRELIAAERQSFGRWLTAWETLLAVRWPEDPALVQQLLTEAVRARTMDLCR